MQSIIDLDEGEVIDSQELPFTAVILNYLSLFADIEEIIKGKKND